MSRLFDLPHFPLSHDSIDPAMPKDGDAVIVLCADGSTGMFTLGLDIGPIHAKIAADETLSLADERQLDVAQRALARYVAASTPKVMQALIDMSLDPSVQSAVFSENQLN